MYVCTYMTVDIIIISFEFCSEATYSVAVCSKMAATCKILGLCTLMLCYCLSTVISVKEQGTYVQMYNVFTYTFIQME